MSEERKVVRLWDGDAETAEPPLRRPNQQNSVNLNDSVDLSESFNSSLNVDDDILSKSKLSVDAQEWYPSDYKNLNSSSSRHSAQDRLNRIKMRETPENYAERNGQKNLDLNNSNPIVKLQEIIENLIEDPGQFDDLLDTFTKTISHCFEDINMTSLITDMICDNAITQPSFRYNAARLCKAIEEKHSCFRKSLHLTCKKKVEEIPYDYNLALFLAELLMQLNCDNLYGQFVIDTVEMVLSLGGNDNVKAVCQVLKLTGASLELNHLQAIDKIFIQLENIKPIVPIPVVNHINAVVALRTSNWGLTASNPSSSNPTAQTKLSYEGPILYGPDGQELTEEEQNFLAESAYDSDEVDFNPEMDEEAKEAFRQFLKFK